MAERDKIPSSVNGPITPPRRPTSHLDRARSMLEQSKAPATAEEDATPPEAARQEGRGEAPPKVTSIRPAPVVPPESGEAEGTKKLTTRVPGEQFRWLRDEAKGYKERNPKRPRVTIEELISIAIDHLRETKNLDAVIAKHRS